MFRAMYEVGGSRPEDGVATVDHIVAVHARKGDHDNVVDLARSIRRARWDQIARGRRRPSHDVVSASLSRHGGHSSWRTWNVGSATLTRTMLLCTRSLNRQYRLAIDNGPK
jgi:hypothetical protein